MKKYSKAKTNIFLFDFLYLIIGSVWLFFMLITSGEYTQLKTNLLLILSVFSCLEIILFKNKIPKSLFTFIFIFVIYSIFSLLLGIINGYEFFLSKDFSLLQNYIFTPIFIFILYMIFYKNNYRITILIKIITYITIILLILNIGCFLSVQNIIPKLSIFDFVTVNTDTLSYEKIAFRINNESSLMFLLPLYIVFMFVKTNKKIINVKLIYIIVILGVIYTLLSGRKMLEIAVGATFIIMFLSMFRTLSIKNIKKILLLIATIIIIIAIVNAISSTAGIDNIFNKIFMTITNGLNSSADGVIKRKNNFSALIELWMNSPLIGNGLNAYALQSLASSVTKWSYEIVYIALLAQTGIIGFCIFFYGIWFILKRLYVKFKISNDGLYLAVLFGFASFVICGASNPLVYFIWPWVVSLTICDRNHIIN